jgi:TrmH family RNA methyltransferase
LDTITIGKHNPRIADIRKAIDRGTLTSDGLLPVEGPKLIQEAMRSGLELTTLFLRDGVTFGEAPSAVTAYALEPAVFKGIQSTEHSQGVIALVRPRACTLNDVLGKSPAPIVVLAGLQDPGNVGTILRIAESFGAAGCIGLSGTASVHNSKVVRASAGSVFRIPHVWNVAWSDAISTLKSAGIALLGTSPHAKETILDWDWKKPSAILLGNEGAGLSDEQSSACNQVLRIPQEGSVESLNSAIAGAVTLYESYRQRNKA